MSVDYTSNSLKIHVKWRLLYRCSRFGMRAGASLATRSTPGQAGRSNRSGSGDVRAERLEADSRRALPGRRQRQCARPFTAGFEAHVRVRLIPRRYAAQACSREARGWVNLEPRRSELRGASRISGQI